MFTLRRVCVCVGSVSTETRLWAGKPEFNPRQENDGIFSLRHRSVQTGSGTHPASNRISTRGSFTRPRREADHSPPSSYTSTPQYVFMVWCLVKHSFTTCYNQSQCKVHCHFLSNTRPGLTNFVSLILNQKTCMFLER
jgi:hypothetical protein